MDFLRQVGAEISLTTQSRNIGRYSFPLMGRGQGVSTVRRLINAESEGSSSLDQEEIERESVGDWEGTVELAETVTVPPLCVRIARCRVVRRNVSTVVKVPRNQEVLVDPEGLPGVLVARIVATLDGIMSSTNVGGLTPFMVTTVKSPLVESVFSPRDKFVVSSDKIRHVPEQDCGFLNVGAGERLPELPEHGLLVATIRHRNGLQAESRSLPVQNGIGIQDDTKYGNAAQINREELKGHERNEITKPQEQRDVKKPYYCNEWECTCRAQCGIVKHCNFSVPLHVNAVNRK